MHANEGGPGSVHRLPILRGGACSAIIVGQLEAEKACTEARNMALLVDKYRPRSLDALTYHPDLSERLKSLVGYPLVSCTLQFTRLSRPKAEISRICLSMVPLVLARRRV